MKKIEIIHREPEEVFARLANNTLNTSEMASVKGGKKLVCRDYVGNCASIRCGVWRTQ